MTNGEWLYIFAMEDTINDLVEEEVKNAKGNSPTYLVRKKQE